MERLYLNTPIPQVHLIKLVSCSLHNSWHNLKSAAQLYFGEDKEVLASIPQGHYTFQSLAEELTESLSSFENKRKNRS